MQLRSDVRRDEPDQLGGQHQDDEPHAGDGDQAPGRRRLGQVLRDLSADN